ncbi:dihydroorotase [Legionella impletisoli]|uniref:Dihydroorotase n=1 Tax=Legionella impletisoli TaxID=343510 RepID=A0A917JWH6_9GAMM|nr:dihydroorotase [Legionella impletisoli]GGI87286.1 dihydroorotase [Legionella impletisoli]
MRCLEITRPDDWHVHFRDEKVLEQTVSATALHFKRALVMPNLKPPLTTIKALLSYRERILAANKTQTFIPYMTFYLNEEVNLEELQQTKTNPYILGAKLYPAGATTNAEAGAKSIKALYSHFEIMQENDLVLQIHGEVTEGDIFDREAQFIEIYLKPLLKHFPKLRMVLEHISTSTAVEFVSNAPETVAATITPHHLMFNRNRLLAGGIRPHYYCLPILKSHKDQTALQQAAISGNPKFFAGTDSAPHARSHKESACGCAGIYSAPYALAMYTEVFDQLEALTMLNAFMSQFGARFYHLPPNQELIELQHKRQVIPETLPFGNDVIIPVLAGESLSWSVYGD